MQKVSEEGLVRAIRRWDLVSVVLNSIIGAGIFVLPAKSFGLIGSYSLLAFVVCAFVVALIVLCFAEVSSRFAATGGPYLYAREAFGPAVGFQVGWLNWIARVTAYATNCNLLVVYLSFFWPAAGAGFWRAVVITLLTLTLTVINVIGVRDAALTSNIFTVAKLLPLVLFIGAGLFFLTPANFTLGEYPSYGSFSTAVLLLVYAFTGFENASVPAGEVLNPRRNMPAAILIGLVIVTLIYVLIQTVSIGTLPALGDTERPLADAANRFLGPVGGSLIAAGAITSVVGNLNVNLLTSPRILFAMSSHHEIPQLFSRIHNRFRTPYVAILVTASLTLVLTLSSSLIYVLTVSTIARLLAYAVTCGALPRLRRKQDAPPALVTVPGGPWISLSAILLSVWLLSNSTLQEARDAAIAAAFGVAIYVVYRLRKQRQDESKVTERIATNGSV
ncbi:MAG TPA: amino acid permease [Pyrinomonadaceae bacterium]|nr:amino acid permease [Pyrinomonadaceae bacterium]